MPAILSVNVEDIYFISIKGPNNSLWSFKFLKQCRMAGDSEVPARQAAAGRDFLKKESFTSFKEVEWMEFYFFLTRCCNVKALEDALFQLIP